MAKQSPSHDHNIDEDEDSDWEYEYHETETESFYVTVDLSSATNPYRPGKQKDSNESKVAAEATASRENNSSIPHTGSQNAATQQDEEILDAPDITIEQGENLDEPSATTQQDGENVDGNGTVLSISMSNFPSNVDKEIPPTSNPGDRIQILDLHSPNPIISYQNQIYSCEWASTIGTDVLLTAPDPDFPGPVLKEEPGVSVLATASIKLFGKPVQMATRNSEEATPAPDQATPVKIPVNIASKKARQNQAKFLERLIAIKAAKGEKDEVTVYAQKANDGSMRRSQQQGRRADEGANADVDLDDESAPTTPIVRRASTRGRGRGGRARGSNSRRSGPRSRKRLLFKDYRPQLSPTDSNDKRFQPSATPTSWDQLSPSPSRSGEQSNIVQPTTATPFSTPPSVPTPGYHPPASRPSIDPPNTGRTSIDTAPNVPPDPDEANRNPDADPMHSSAPLMAESECEQLVSATGRGADGPSPVGDEAMRSVGGGGDAGVLVDAVERNCGSDVEMEDG